MRKSSKCSSTVSQAGRAEPRGQGTVRERQWLRGRAAEGSVGEVSGLRRAAGEAGLMGSFSNAGQPHYTTASCRGGLVPKKPPHVCALGEAVWKHWLRPETNKSGGAPPSPVAVLHAHHAGAVRRSAVLHALADGVQRAVLQGF